MSTLLIEQKTIKKINWEYKTISIRAEDLKDWQTDYTFPGKPNFKKEGDTITVVLKKPISQSLIKRCFNCRISNRVPPYLSYFSCFNCGTSNTL